MPYLLAFVGLVIAIVAAGFLGLRHLGQYMRWQHRATRGLGYFGLTRAQKAEFKADMLRRSRLANLVMKVTALPARGGNRMPPTFGYEGVRFPHTSNHKLLEAMRAYEPTTRDVFVATHMKSGTTWMLHVAYQVLTRGRGDLSDDGHRHIHGVCPWPESVLGVPLDEAPSADERGRRVLKTHLHPRLCPHSDDARYIVVARHPASVLASARDFLGMMSGPFAPNETVLAEALGSERCMWGPWAEHVAGWYERSEQHDNTLFVTFEEMKADLGAVVDRVAAHLEVALTADERATIVEVCGFASMKAHEDRFEMSPPNMFSVRAGGSFLSKGQRTEKRELDTANRERVCEDASRGLADAGFPTERYYPDLAG